MVEAIRLVRARRDRMTDQYNSEHEPRFAVGDWVQDRNDRGFVGEIVRPATRSGGTFWYDVRTQSGQRSSRPEATLVPHEPNPDPEDLFISSSFGRPIDLIRLLTFRKLSRPNHGTLYSIGGSRTEFHPHQYKPLIKFLDSHKHRLLLADEVGLGKTIEAGLILIEQRARDALDRVLVVCPASLAMKWKQEMWERFDEDFEILSSSRFVDMHQRWIREGPPLDFRGIISLQALRSRRVRERLEKDPIGFDLLIVDEAHHLRNPETLSHKVVAELLPESHVALLLSATPIQLGNENLFYLMRLMDPGEFQSYEVFQERIAANTPIVAAERIARASHPPDLAAIREKLEEALRIQPTYFATNPLFLRAYETVARGSVETLSDRIRLQDDLRELNLLGGMICRSMRRDVFENAPIRKPFVYSAPITPEERAFYDAVTDFVRQQHTGRGNIEHLVAVQAQRQAASCMPAARDRFLARAWGRVEDPEEWDLQEEIDFDDLHGGPEGISPPERLIRAAERLGSTDSKFELLRQALTTLYEEEPDAKVLIFSYFKDTLHYLHRRLMDAGYRCEVIHGDVPSSAGDPDNDERRQRMGRFRDPDSGIQILLSSEVGSEGLDFQFCHVLVNYDLPWNPMKVEQRIGRLDRMGQKSPRIVIINLSLRDTIEDRILWRLHMRIGIFKQSIGDLESIIGDEIGRLTRDLLTRRLTPEEEDERIARTAAAIETRRREYERLEKEAPRFMDPSFEARLNEARSGGQILAPDDIAGLVQHYLEVSSPDSRLRVAGDDIFELEPAFHLVQHVRNLPAAPVRNRFYSRLQRPPVRLTFNADRAYQDDRLEFVGHHHPLVALAVQYFERHPQTLYPAFSLAVTPVGDIQEGLYAFGLFHRIERGRDERAFIEPMVLDLESMQPLDRTVSLELVNLMMREGTPWESPPAPPDVARALMDRIRDEMVHRSTELDIERRSRNENTIRTQLASLERTHQVRMRQHEERLATLRERGRGESVIRMTEAQLRHEEARYRHQKEELERGLDFSSTHELFACGVVSVRRS